MRRRAAAHIQHASSPLQPPQFPPARGVHGARGRVPVVHLLVVVKRVPVFWSLEGVVGVVIICVFYLFAHGVRRSNARVLVGERCNVL